MSEIPVRVHIHKFDSLAISYEDRRIAESSFSSYDRPAQWRMNLVASSTKFLFFAIESKIYVKEITPLGLRDTPMVLFADSTEPAPRTDDGHDESQLINALRTGTLDGKEILVAVDTHGQVKVWECESLECILTKYVQKSAWSIAFIEEKEVKDKEDGKSSIRGTLAVGSNSHKICLISLRDPKKNVEILEGHEHNIPTLDAHEDYLVSGSIDSSFVIRKGEQLLERHDMGAWCWSCRIIPRKEVEFESTFGMRRNFVSIKELHRDYTARDHRILTREAHYTDVDRIDGDFDDYEYEGDNDFDNELEQLAIEWARANFLRSHVEATSEPPEGSYDGSGQESYESDTAFLNRQRFDRLVDENAVQRARYMTDNDSLDIGRAELEPTNSLWVNYRYSDDDRVGSEKDCEHLTGIDYRFSKNSDVFIAVSTNTDLLIYLYDTKEILFQNNLADLYPSDSYYRDDPIFYQFNRLCMMEWVADLSCLFVANQNGQIYMIHLMRTPSGALHVDGIPFDQGNPVSSIAGFTVFECRSSIEHPLSASTWNLYILYQDGTHMIVKIDRDLSIFDHVKSIP